jgi:peptidoglycan/LPS O-acetylase OafA/YrhL
MRGVAVLLVVLTHVAGATTGIANSVPGRLLAHANLGVTIFFLISGFLLFRPFVAARAGGPPAPPVASYAKRRALRVLPAYWLALAVLRLVPGVPGLGGVRMWPMVTLTQVLPIYHGYACSELLSRCSLAQTWSLGAEASFYLALPLYVIVVERLTARASLRTWAAVHAGALGVLAAVSMAVQFGLAYPAPLWVGWTVVGTVLWFGLGMGLAVVSVLADRMPGVVRFAERTGAASVVLWVIAAAIYVALCLGLPASAFVSSPGRLLLVHVGFGAVSLLLLAPIVLAGPRRAAPQRLSGSWALSRLGLISYGVFLWHFAVVIALGPAHGMLGGLALLAGTLAVSVVVATASYVLLERPLMRLKYRPLTRRTPWSRTPERLRASAR